MRIALFVGLPALASLGLASMLSAVAVAQDAGHAVTAMTPSGFSAAFCSAARGSPMSLI